MNVLFESPRLLFRELIAKDIPLLFEMDSNREVHRYLGNFPLQTPEEAEAVILMIQKQYNENGIGRWALIEKQSGEFLGWAGLKLVKEEINGHNNFYDLGFRLMPNYWGCGYATEAATSLVKYASEILKLKNLYAFVDVENKASIRVLEKSGLKNEGRFLYEHQAHFWFHLSM
ncbi:MAG: GNAT family N-acetyltransferase [Bacteroidia bacterium]|jgi:RimJ/RimL family protein N-acetyltransferase|nr:GNAT family N-acetyltransferase [Bacteroidia bacterium]